MLEPNIEKAWKEYVAAEKDRIREIYLARLRNLIKQLESMPQAQRFAWARNVSRQSVDEGLTTPIRMPLFQEVLFPALLSGIQARKPGCARWLAGFSQLLCKSPQCQSQLAPEHQGEIGLLREALIVDPCDTLARSRLIAALQWQLDYSLHELPAGVLYGHNGATVEQCGELNAELDEFVSLVTAQGTLGEHKDLITDCRHHFSAYAEYLARSSEYHSYKDYLAEIEE